MDRLPYCNAGFSHMPYPSMGLASWFRKILGKQAIVEEFGDEENTKIGEFDDKN